MAVSGGGGGGKSIEAGKAHVTFEAKDGGLEAYMGRIGAKVSKFGSALTGIGGSVMGMGAAVLGPLAGLFMEVVGHFDNVNDAADRLGTTTEQISRLGYAADLAGSNIEDVEAAGRVLQKQLEKQPEGFTNALDKLGLSAGELKDMELEDQFLAIADAVGKLDGGTRGPMLQMILGKGGAKLAPMLKDGAAALKAALEEADAVGDTVDSLDASQAAQTADALDKVWKSVKNTFRSVGAAFLPLADAIEGGLGTFLTATAGIRQFIGANRSAIQSVAAFAAGVVVIGGAITGLGVAVQVVGFALSGLALLFSPFVIITATIAAATAALLYFSKTADGAGGSVGMLRAMGETFRETFAGITDALEAGDMELAWETMLAGLRLAWNQFLEGIWASLQKLWAKIKIGWQESAANAALAQGKTQDEGAWYDGIKTLADEFNREVLGGEDKAASGALLKKDGKTVLSEKDQHLKDAVKSHTEQLAELEKTYDETLAKIEASGQENIQKLKDQLAEKRSKAAEAAANARYWKDYFKGLDEAEWAAKAGAAARSAVDKAGGAGGTFRGRFAAESIQASATLEKIEKNTKKTNDILSDIEDDIGGVPVE